MSGEDLVSDAVSLPESAQNSFSEVGRGDVLNGTINHTSKYPHNPGGERGGERGRKRGRERIDNIVQRSNNGMD